MASVKRPLRLRSEKSGNLQPKGVGVGGGEKSCRRWVKRGGQAARALSHIV